MEAGILPAKRPFEAMQAGITQAQRHTDTSFELHNYQPSKPPKQGLSCWARLDLKTTQLQQTMASGPPMSSVKWRRTIDAKTRRVITNCPIDHLDNETFPEPEALDIITELWHDHASPHFVFEVFDDNIEEITHAWDGSPENLGPSRCNYFFKTYVNKLAQRERDLDTTLSESEGEFDDMTKGMPAKTRQQQKAEEKELHWRHIMAQPHDYIQKFVEATVKEAKSFMTWKCHKPLSPQEEEKVLADPVLKKRVINSRGCYRDESKNVGPVNAKTRIVAQGNQDPDLRSLTRQSPPPNRVAEFLILVTFISGINQMAFETAMAWKLWIADAATAFLQGTQDVSERAGKLYLRAPRDPIIALAGVFRSRLYEITGNLYGLSNAPVTWSREVTARLALGFQDSLL